MIARLWWKDARQFGPAWVLVALAAMGGLMIAGRVPEPDGRDGLLYAIAVMGSCLYALAIASAAIAGEREHRTLRLLDALPAPRGRVWDGKATFAAITSIALTLLLLILAAWRSEPDSLVRVGGPVAVLAVLVLVLEAIGWGLFWSALLDHVLAAAALAVCSLLLASPILAGATGGVVPDGLAGDAPTRLLIALLTAGASRLIFLASGPRRWVRRAGPVPRKRPAPAEKAAPVDEVGHSEAPRTGWPRAAASLAWQATREARSGWPMLALLGLGVPIVAAAASVRMFGDDAIGLAMALNLLVALLAGVGVFHSEQRGRSFRFLAHHGVRPALLWPIKVAAWVLALLLVWAPYLILFASGFFQARRLGPPSGWGIYGIALAGCFAVGVLCGMAIRRGITATLVAVLIVLALVVPIGILASIGLMSYAWAALVPPALLAVAWGWTGPWLLERPGPGRWLRLGGLLAAAGAVLFPIYVGIRILGVPDPGPLPADLRARLAASPDRADDAGPLYREATLYLRHLEELESRVPEVGGPAGAMGEPSRDPTPDQIGFARPRPDDVVMPDSPQETRAS